MELWKQKGNEGFIKLKHLYYDLTLCINIMLHIVNQLPACFHITSCSMTPETFPLQCCCSSWFDWKYTIHAQKMAQIWITPVNFFIIKNAICQRMRNEIQPWMPLILYKVREGGSGWERAKQHVQELRPVVISMWWIQTNAGLLWDTEVHSRWRKLKSCNCVFLWGCCNDSQIFIKAHCCWCDYHMLSLIHLQKPALSSPFLCRALSFIELFDFHDALIIISL